MTVRLSKRRDKTITLFIILDGFRHDYLDRVDYLPSIADWRGNVRETFGFISTRPAMCAGVYPDQTGLCFEYQFRPEGTTFRPLLFNLLNCCSKVLPASYLRLAATAWVRLMSRTTVPRQTAMIGHMPFNLQPLFEHAEHRVQTDNEYLSFPTIYDLLRSQNQRFVYMGFARSKKCFELAKRAYSIMVKHDLFESDETMVKQFKVALQACRPSFAHLHFSCTDWIGHKFGPNSEQMTIAARRLDDMVRWVHEYTLKHYGHVRIIASADHGMVEVDRHHNLDAQVLSKLNVREPEDYICFRDSTTARFWFFNPQARLIVKKALEVTDFGHIVDDAYRRKHRLNFTNNANGDLIFRIDPGAVLFPNYYQGGGTPPRGMHGYDPDTKDNHGAIVIHDPEGRFAINSGETLDLVDVFPTMVDMHDLPKPKRLPGRSVYAS